MNNPMEAALDGSFNKLLIYIDKKYAHFRSNYIKRVPPRVPLSQDETVSNKKESLGNSLYDLVLNGRGDRIRTCDLVLPKHPRYQAAPRPAT